VILTLDLGSSTTKAVVWDADGPRARGDSPLETSFPAADRAEQDPGRWWPSVVAACAEARAGSPASFAAVSAVGFAAARQTLVPVTAAGRPLGPALLWSDRRAAAEAAALADSFGGAEAVRRLTGGVLDGAAVAAKGAWLAAHEPDRLAGSRWLLTPRDLIVFEMTGAVLTDRTMVSAAGLCDAAGGLVAGLLESIGDRLPPVVAPDTVAGALSPRAASELGLPKGVPVVVGAGDRACEVLGAGAATDRPMVSWGTTANVSVPVAAFPDPPPDGVVVSRAAGSGFLLEGGLSTAGSLIRWLSDLTGVGADALMARAADCPAGAGGVIALPWFGGARAPWWRAGARGGFVGVSFEHDAGHLARAAVESVAVEVLRCLEATAAPAASLALTGADGRTTPWAEVLSGITGLPALRRRSGQAASAGAALLTAAATGAGYELETMDPVTDTVAPDPAAVARYRPWRAAAEAAAHAVLGLGGDR
jgi:xylulokinase